MQYKKKWVKTILFALPLCAWLNTVSASAPTSNFLIRLFNNTSINQPLHYRVMSEEQPTVEGELAVGDKTGKSIYIVGKEKDKQTAEVVLSDSTGRVVWDSQVTYYKSPSEFYTKIIALDSQYSVGSNVFPSIQAIVFDIHKG